MNLMRWDRETVAGRENEVAKCPLLELRASVVFSALSNQAIQKAVPLVEKKQ